MIDPTFTQVNGLSVISFENQNDRTSFSRYYVPNVQINDFNVLIEGKSFFDMPIKNDEEMMKKMTKKNDKLSKWEEAVITRQATYWIMNTFQNILS